MAKDVTVVETEKSTDAPVSTPENAPEVKITRLRAPKSISLIGTVVSLNERRKGDKFRHDTKIVVVEEFGTKKLVDVFITFNQWKEYGCENIIYKGNVVSFELEECIEGVTGYYESEGDDDLTAHEASFLAFARSVETSIFGLLDACSTVGMSSAITEVFCKTVTQIRSFHS